MGGLTHHPGCFHGRGESESAEVLSEVARHEERETKEPMTHPVNTRPLWASSGPMNCPSAKQSQLISLHQSSRGSELWLTVELWCLRLLVSQLRVTASDNHGRDNVPYLWSFKKKKNLFSQCRSCLISNTQLFCFSEISAIMKSPGRLKIPSVCLMG